MPRSRTDVADAADVSDAEPQTHVTMVRDLPHSAPHSANVHVDEVENWKRHDWRVAE